MTRSQVAQRIGRSIATVRRLEGVELHPVRDATGVYLFDPADVEDFLGRRQEAARWNVPASGDWKRWLHDERNRRGELRLRVAKSAKGPDPAPVPTMDMAPGNDRAAKTLERLQLQAGLAVAEIPDTELDRLPRGIVRLVVDLLGVTR